LLMEKKMIDNVKPREIHMDNGVNYGMVEHPRYATSNTRTKHIEKSNPHTVSVSQNQCLINGGKPEVAGHYTYLLKNNGSDNRKRPSQRTSWNGCSRSILRSTSRAIRDMKRVDTMIYPHKKRNALRTPILMISTYTQHISKL